MKRPCYGGASSLLPVSAFITEFGDIALIAVTPQVENATSCRVLEKAGYERCWVGVLDSNDPADAGEAALYVTSRPSRRWCSARRFGPTIGI